MTITSTTASVLRCCAYIEWVGNEYDGWLFPGAGDYLRNLAKEFRPEHGQSSGAEHELAYYEGPAWTAISAFQWLDRSWDVVRPPCPTHYPNPCACPYPPTLGHLL
jgi:hypothetical protein